MAPNETTTQFGYKHPEILTDIHSQYIKAGSDIIYASTFGINRFKINEIEGNLDDGVKSAMAAAQIARDNENKDVKIFLQPPGAFRNRLFPGYFKNSARVMQSRLKFMVFPPGRA